jgi:hypothetical protein
MNDGMYEFGEMSCNAFVDLLLTLNEYELTILASAIGLLIAPSITTNQQNSLGNFFELVGQILLTINAQAINLQPYAPSRQELDEKIKRLERELSILKRQNNF